MRTRDGRTIQPVREVSFDLAGGTTLALVGESGCGKSLTCLALAGLLPQRATSSAERFVLCGEPQEIAGKRRADAARRRKVSVVFQDATNGLNPVKPIGWQIAEAVRLRAGGTWREARRAAVRLLHRVGMPDAQSRAASFPHQLSGGMNQRAMIALALAGDPSVLIADEATTALDVTVQAQILALLAKLRDEVGLSIILVTHDLGVVAQFADRVAVMYAGRIVETAGVGDLFAAPRHPYTEGLLASLPRADRRVCTIKTIPGEVPAPDQMPPGCAFAPRCEFTERDCKAVSPSMRALMGDRLVACHHPRPVDLRQVA